MKYAIGMVAVTLGIVGAVGAAVYLWATPGTEVARVDLFGPAPEVSFEAKAGDRIRFALDVTSPLTIRNLKPKLGRSTLALALTDPPESTTCALFDGTIRSSTKNDRMTSLEGVVVGCELKARGGTHNVKAEMKPDPDAKLTGATLVVYVDSP